MAYANVVFSRDHRIRVEGELSEIESAIVQAKAEAGIWRVKSEDRDVLIMVDQVRAVRPAKEGDSSMYTA